MRYLMLWVISVCGVSPVYSQSLVSAAKERLNHVVIYDGSYQQLDYPMGDVADSRGVCTDVIIRAYRQLGIDLQQRVHEDMQQHFSSYPDHWGLSQPDSNIDHRRVPNLEVFFARFGQTLPVTQSAGDYQPGDLVTWRLSGSGRPHIGVVSDLISTSGNPLIIHNIGWGPQQNDMLFDHPISGHYRYHQAIQH
ncbi:DUF1287 domain-containing protein [Marinicella sediminis]|uniref:DUF1287 domain-containing protein n=1 Tax=Marinicella sediminis TaxID=1792834 RepID=A0ABV7JDT3_9GAMM|nr:DUF1287 domain-containing protein [Marinicella sediminis]